MSHALYNNNHELNRPEAIERLKYWVDHFFSDARARGAIKLLVGILEQNYETTPPVDVERT
jgi:hypothetical protein